MTEYREGLMDQEKPKKRKTWLIIVIVLVVLCCIVVACGYGGYLLYTEYGDLIMETIFGL